VIIEAPAFSDIDDIFAYIANTLKEPGIAERIFDSIQAAIASLRQFPMRHGGIIEGSFASKEIRRMPAENYIVLYTVDRAKNEVHVLRIMYSRRELPNLF